MATVVVSIGRGIGASGQILSSVEWSEFISDVQASFDNLAEIVYKGIGEGIYEGTSEASFTVIATTDVPESVRYWLGEVALPLLAEKYQQDSIALTIGETYFVKATVTV